VPKGNRPAFIARAKTGRKDAEDRDIFINVGAAWRWQNGHGYSMRLDTLPIGFDGHLLLTEPRDDEP